MVPETDVQRALLWANKRNRPELLDQYRIEVDVAPVSITIFECRPPWRPGGDPSWTRFPIARLDRCRFDALGDLAELADRRVRLGVRGQRFANDVAG